MSVDWTDWTADFGDLLFFYFFSDVETVKSVTKDIISLDSSWGSSCRIGFVWNSGEGVAMSQRGDVCDNDSDRVMRRAVVTGQFERRSARTRLGAAQPCRSDGSQATSNVCTNYHSSISLEDHRSTRCATTISRRHHGII